MSCYYRVMLVELVSHLKLVHTSSEVGNGVELLLLNALLLVKVFSKLVCLLFLKTLEACMLYIINTLIDI